MKLCKNCKYMSLTRECRHEKSVFYSSLVTGNKDYRDCFVMRRATHPCNIDAVLFEPKLTMLERIKQWMMNRKSITKE